MEAKTILIVEDDDSIAGFIVSTIQQETHYQPVRAIDGQHAVKLMHWLLPDLLILDYNLPGMNGIELYDRIHARKEFEGVPAFMITAYQKVCADEAKLRHIPCLKNPFELDDFLDTVESLITPTNGAYTSMP